MNWGYASSPLLHDGALFVQVLHGMKTDDPSYLLRIDGKSGKTMWRIERPTRAIEESPDSYTTPARSSTQTPTASRSSITGGDVVTGHDPATGKELWRMDGLNPTNNPSNRIIASPARRRRHRDCADARTADARDQGGGRGDVTRTHRLWSFDNGPDVPTPVSDGKLLYTVTDRGVAYALDVRPAKSSTDRSGSGPTATARHRSWPTDRIYVTSENEGLTSVYRAGPKFELLAENPLDDYCLSSPAISEGQIFIRTTGHLWAIGQRKK